MYSIHNVFIYFIVYIIITYIFTYSIYIIYIKKILGTKGLIKLANSYDLARGLTNESMLHYPPVSWTDLITVRNKHFATKEGKETYIIIVITVTIYIICRIIDRI